jgi:hypothetical protein
LVLKFRVGGLSGRLLLPEVMPVATADQGGEFVAYGQPGLGPLPGVEIHRSPWAAHPRARPAGIDGVALRQVGDFVALAPAHNALKSSSRGPRSGV